MPMAPATVPSPGSGHEDGMGDLVKCPECGRVVERVEHFEFGPRGAGDLYWHVGDVPGRSARTCWFPKVTYW